MKTKNRFGHKATDEWIANQAIWHDRDMIASAITGSIFGLLIGLLF